MRAIVRYLVRRPESKDTIDGIRWWIPSCASHISELELEGALDDMVKRGWLSVAETSVAKPIYGLSPQFLDLFRFLNQ